MKCIYHMHTVDISTKKPQIVEKNIEIFLLYCEFPAGLLFECQEMIRHPAHWCISNIYPKIRLVRLSQIEFCWVLLSPVESAWVCWVWLSPFQSDWVHLSLVESGWVRLSPVKSGWVQFSLIESSWVWLSPVDSRWVRLSSIEFSWVQLTPAESSWVKHFKICNFLKLLTHLHHCALWTNEQKISGLEYIMRYNCIVTW